MSQPQEIGGQESQETYTDLERQLLEELDRVRLALMLMRDRNSQIRQLYQQVSQIISEHREIDR